MLGRFNVDTVPPDAPTGLGVSLKDRTLRLAWTANTEPDLAAYRVYRSGSALSGFTVVATTETPGFSDAIEGIAYYRVTAVDKGATLTILPGVVIRFAPGAEGIVVKDGALVARGTPAQRITFTSASERPRAGDFGAAVVVRAKTGQTSALEEVVVEHAGVGVRVESGGVEVLRAEIAKNLQSGVEVSGTGVLKLGDSRVAGQPAGTGVTVQGFGRAVLRGNSIVDNGWAVVNYSGNQVDARENWWGAGTPAEGLFVGDVAPTAHAGLAGPATNGAARTCGRPPGVQAGLAGPATVSRALR